MPTSSPSSAANTTCPYQVDGSRAVAGETACTRSRTSPSGTRTHPRDLLVLKAARALDWVDARNTCAVFKKEFERVVGWSVDEWFRRDERKDWLKSQCQPYAVWGEKYLELTGKGQRRSLASAASGGTSGVGGAPSSTSLGRRRRVLESDDEADGVAGMHVDEAEEREASELCGCAEQLDECTLKFAPAACAEERAEDEGAGRGLGHCV